MNNKKRFILLFLLLQIPNISCASNLNLSNYDNKEITLRTQNKWNKENSKINKRMLKKEIKKRKKYHRKLLELYNKNFNTVILEEITRNWLIISEMRAIYTK